MGPGAEAILWPLISLTPSMLRFVEEIKTSSAEERSSGRSVASDTSTPTDAPISSSTLRVIPDKQPEVSGGVVTRPARTQNIFGDFAALVEQHNFVKPSLLRFVIVPDIVEPGEDLYTGERR